MHQIDPDYIKAKARFGQARVICPACTPSRKTKGETTLSIKQDEKGIVWRCWHCSVQGSMGNENKQMVNPPKPAPVIPMKVIRGDPINEDGLSYLEARGISAETCRELGVLSGQRFFRKAGGEMSCIGFPYNHQDRLTAIKWRSIESKDFTQDGSAQTLFLAGRISVGSDLVITEGEIDALSFWEAGIPAVSIPSGALTAGAEDDSNRLRWMSHHDDLIKAARNVYLAVDMDGPGQTTANELARRIGKLKCWRVNFPEGCKDANDALLKLGKDGLAKVRAQAQRWPVEGLAAPADFMDKVLGLYRDGLPRGTSTGWQNVDEIFTLNPGSLVIVTGTPGSGKSQFIDNVLVNAMVRHDYRVAYSSFENPPELHLAKLISLKAGKPFGDGPTPRIERDEMMEALGWINERVTFLTNDGVMPTVDSLVERLEAAVRRSGVKAVVVDPFNFIKLNSKKDSGIDTESINEMLAQFKTFASRSEVTFFLVAHPAKPMNQGPDWVPTGYSVASSAHFFNRADFGITMQRKANENVLHVWKCRFPWQGQIGTASLSYDKATGRFNEATPVRPIDDDGLILRGYDETAPF